LFEKFNFRKCFFALPHCGGLLCIASNGAKKTTTKLVIFQWNFCFDFIDQLISSRASGVIMNNRRCSAAQPPDKTLHKPKPCKGDMMNTKQR
jgi:hypothetical protein